MGRGGGPNGDKGAGKGGKGKGKGGGKGKGKGLRPGQRPVSEDARINIKQMLENFQISDETEMSFPPNLNNHDRAVVHAECLKFGYTSKSFGKGENRCVHVFKPKAKNIEEQDVHELALSSVSIQLLEAFVQVSIPRNTVQNRAAQTLAVVCNPSRSLQAATRDARTNPIPPLSQTPHTLQPRTT
ncbi:hypothetical protein CYMTET_11756 [Cymbomonas tetramitiformis]|uniref:R3H domain-containing protein n=1 Tax=Cymbomonas tetramitiformis TaxID=36881 RepID=A0AAE0GN22_9CHLO|nr:hypothetical protein CYMTET_11756 [Cymbomonas tetramitiformis]